MNNLTTHFLHAPLLHIDDVLIFFRLAALNDEDVYFVYEDYGTDGQTHEDARVFNVNWRKDVGNG
jgi:hypothetical protein